MHARNKLVLALATLALALPLISAPAQDRRDWKRDQKDRREQRREERREQNQNQNQNQNGNQNPQGSPPPTNNALPAPKLIGPGPHAGDWLRHLGELPPQQQEQQLESDPNFRKLNPTQQQNLRQRLQWFSSRPADQQQRILERMETREHLTPEQKFQERQLFQRYQGLPIDRRRAVHNALVALHSLPPDQRQQALSSPEYRARFSDQEREMLARALQFGTSPNMMKPNPD